MPDDKTLSLLMKNQMMWVVHYQSNRGDECTVILPALGRAKAIRRVELMCSGQCQILSSMRLSHRQKDLLASFLRLCHSELSANRRIEQLQNEAASDDECELKAEEQADGV